MKKLIEYLELVLLLCEIMMEDSLSLPCLIKIIKLVYEVYKKIKKSKMVRKKKLTLKKKLKKIIMEIISLLMAHPELAYEVTKDLLRALKNYFF